MSQVINMDVVEELLSLCEEGDPELLVDLIRMFLEDGPMKIGVITQSLSGRDWEALERAAHSLKGSAGNLGASRVLIDCEALQLACRKGELDGVEATVHQLVQNFKDAELALQDILSRYS
jgi:HPt (histidine-containing phosphotransfer) domain-containing protein